MQTPNLDKMLQDAGNGASLFTLEKEVPAALKEFTAWKADIEKRLAAVEATQAGSGGMKAAAIVALLMALASPAYAHQYHNHRYADGRPSAWCGWFARFNFLGHDPGPDYNLAANWRRVGSPDPAPHAQDIVVWSHHVGKIVGQCDGYKCPVWSGNDGHAVRTRVRSVAGAVFRRI